MPEPKTYTVCVRWDRRVEEGHEYTLSEAMYQLITLMLNPNFSHINVEMGDQG